MRTVMIRVLMLVMMLFCSTTFAQQVEVTGVGEDYESAQRDAMRNAVEQVVGTYIDSKTIVDQAEVVQDEIYTKSSGFITNITITEKSRVNGVYKIRAMVEVNTNPNSELMSRIAMINALGDPRIGVVVTYYSDANNEKREKYPLICEAAMNKKLAGLGFNHIVESSFILSAADIQRDYVTDPKSLLPNSDIDYLVFGKIDMNTGDIMLPRYTDITTDGERYEYSTGLVKSDAEMDVTILKSATGEIINTFRINDSAMFDSNNRADNASIKKLGTMAAEKLRSALAKKASSVDSLLQATVVFDNYKDLEKINDILNRTTGIRHSAIKAVNGNKATLDIDTDLKPQTVFRLLREASERDMYLTKSGAGFMEINIS